MSKQLISKAIGIDLGTTNSVVGIMNASDTEIIIHRDATTKRETTPSCVWKNPRSGEIVVGRRAFSRIGTAPSPIKSIKRKMGRQEETWLVDEMITPETVSAHILREMKRQIEEDVARFGTDAANWIVDRAIITVPAYFDQPQIEATRKAGEMAGLQVLELLHEPTAAACYYCFQERIQNGVFMVYDLGGGTFDVSILRSTAGAFEVLGISGNNYLGGDDIDTALARYLLKQLQKEYHLELDLVNDEEDRLRFDKLKLLMEGVKKALSTQDTFLLRDAMSVKDKDNNWVEIESLFERQEIEGLMYPIVKQTIPFCLEALERANEKAGITLADIDTIILVGGSTHIPLVREMVRTLFCADPNVQEPRAKCAEPLYKQVDSIVALGAAIRAASAGGLTIYPPDRSIRVTFRGIGATGARQAHIGGQVEALDASIDLSDGYVRLIIPDRNIEEECELSANGSFGFTRIPLQPGAENLLRVEIYDKQGALLTTTRRSVAQNPDSPVITPADTAVLAKSISLEVERDGRVDRKRLVRAPQTLPLEAHFQFAHPGNTDTVRFSLFQLERKIKEVHVEVPPTLRRGSTIDLRIQVDRLANITCSGTIGHTHFDFAVEAPDDRSITRNDIVSQDNLFHALSHSERVEVEEEWKETRERAIDAIMTDDMARAAHELERMEELRRRVTPAQRITLQPPKADFDKLVQEAHELNVTAKLSADQNGEPHDIVAIQQTIEEQRRLGDMAFKAGDQRAYKEAYDMLENLCNHLNHIIWNDKQETPELKSLLAAHYILHLRERIVKVKPRAQKKKKHDLYDQLVKMETRLQQLSLRTENDPDGVISECMQLDNQLQRIEAQLPEEDGEPPILPVDQSGF